MAVRVTVEDTTAGTTEVFDVAPNDYHIVFTGTCYPSSIVTHANGTHQLTIKGREPAEPKVAEVASLLTHLGNAVTTRQQEIAAGCTCTPTTGRQDDCVVHGDGPQL